MDILPDFDYRDYNTSIYGETETEPSESKKEWYYPVVWLAILVVVIMAAMK